MLFALFQNTAAFERFPATYTIRGTWDVPYMNLTTPILIINEPNRQYTSKFNGLEQVWDKMPSERYHRRVVISDDKPICYGWSKEGEWNFPMTEFLPEPDGFKLKGTTHRRGIKCQLWEKTEDGPQPSTWQMYVDMDGNPLAYVQHAISIYGSHYDIYVLEIHEFYRYAIPGYWDVPENCIDPPDEPEMQEIKLRTRDYRRLGRRNAVKEETCKLYTYQGTDLPNNFTWRDKGVVGPVRDQVACGSCWAFGTAQALEGQLAIKTKKFRELSVNQIMDCTWDYENNGCQGGEAGPAFRSLVDQKAKLALESEYPYIGVSGYCDRNIEHPVLEVEDCYKIEPKTKAVKEAVMKFGPASIGISVPDSMITYTKGLYNDTECYPTASEMVHEVLLTGWKVIDGEEAWEVKNSWSTHWGDNGYIYIQLRNQEWNCGVTTDAKIPIIKVVN